MSAVGDARKRLKKSLTEGCVPCDVCGGSQTRGWHKHDNAETLDRASALQHEEVRYLRAHVEQAEAENADLRATLAAVREWADNPHSARSELREILGDES